MRNSIKLCLVAVFSYGLTVIIYAITGRSSFPKDYEKLKFLSSLSRLSVPPSSNMLESLFRAEDYASSHPNERQEQKVFAQPQAKQNEHLQQHNQAQQKDQDPHPNQDKQVKAEGSKLHSPKVLENKCDSCPVFVSMAVMGIEGRSMNYRGSNFDEQKSSVMFLKSSKVFIHLLGNVHPGCFKFVLYTDDPELVQIGRKQGFGDNVQYVLISDMPITVYDTNHAEEKNRPVNVTKYPNKTIPFKERNWLSISRTKLHIVKMFHHSKGEKVIWADLDTFIATDFSCIYQLPNFIMAPPFGGWGSSRVNRILTTSLYPNLDLSQQDKLLQEQYEKHPEYYKDISLSDFVFGDVWMMDDSLINAVEAVEKELTDKGLMGQFDLQSYFYLLHHRKHPGMHELVEEFPEYCFGFQWVKGDTLPWVKYRANYRTGYFQGELYCTLTCKKVAVMSWNWPSFQMMKYNPCKSFTWDNGWDWFVKNVYRYKNSTLGWLDPICEWNKKGVPKNYTGDCRNRTD